MKPTIDHSCSYHCDRPECIKAQRDEMRERLKQIDAQEPVATVTHYSVAHGVNIETLSSSPQLPVGTKLIIKPEAK